MSMTHQGDYRYTQRLVFGLVSQPDYNCTTEAPSKHPVPFLIVVTANSCAGSQWLGVGIEWSGPA